MDVPILLLSFAVSATVFATTIIVLSKTRPRPVPIPTRERP